MKSVFFLISKNWRSSPYRVASLILSVVLGLAPVFTILVTDHNALLFKKAGIVAAHGAYDIEIFLRSGSEEKIRRSVDDIVAGFAGKIRLAGEPLIARSVAPASSGDPERAAIKLYAYEHPALDARLEEIKRGALEKRNLGAAVAGEEPITATVRIGCLPGADPGDVFRAISKNYSSALHPVHLVGLRLEDRAMRNGIKLCSIISVILSIAAMLTLNLYFLLHRQRQTGILNALGMTRIQIAAAFVVENVVILVCGQFAAFGLAIFLSAALSSAGISTMGRVNFPIAEFPFPAIIQAALAYAVGVIAVMSVALGTIFRFNTASLINPKYFSLYAERKRRTFPWYAFAGLLILSLVSILLYSAVPMNEEIIRDAFLSVLAICVVAVIPYLLLVISGIITWSPLDPLFRPWGREGTIGRAMYRSEFQRHIVAIVCMIIVFTSVLTLKTLIAETMHETRRWASEAILPYTWIRASDLSDIDLTVRPGGGDQAIIAPLGPEVHMPFLVKGFDPAILVEGGATVASWEKEAIRRYSSGEGIILTPSLARELRKSVGDMLELSSLYGRLAFPVLLVTDRFGFFATERSFAILPVKMLDELFLGHASSVDKAVVLRPTKAGRFYGSPPLPRRVVERVYAIFRGDEAYKERLGKTKRDFLFFDLIWFFCLGIAFVSLANSVSMKIIENRTDYGLFYILGATRSQVFKIVFSFGGALIIHSLVVSFLLSQPIKWIAIRTLSRFSGMNLEFSGGFAVFGVVAALALIVGTIALYVPARYVLSRNVANYIRYE